VPHLPSFRLIQPSVILVRLVGVCYFRLGV